MGYTLVLRLPEPLEKRVYRLDGEETLEELGLEEECGLGGSSYLRTAACSRPLDIKTRVSTLSHGSAPSHPIDLVLSVRLLGGKGGFGSQLRAAGGRMSAGKATNVDACRDLSGRRLSTIKEAQRQAELLETTPDLRAAVVAADKAKLEAIERSLGLTSDPSEEQGSSSSSSGKRLADVDLEELARKKHKFDDNTFFEQSREIKDNVRNAVAAGLLKKKKKKTPEGGDAVDTASKSKSSATASKSASTGSLREKEKAKTPAAASSASASSTMTKMGPPPAIAA